MGENSALSPSGIRNYRVNTKPEARAIVMQLPLTDQGTHQRFFASLIPVGFGEKFHRPFRAHMGERIRRLIVRAVLTGQQVAQSGIGKGEKRELSSVSLVISASCLG